MLLDNGQHYDIHCVIQNAWKTADAGGSVEVCVCGGGGGGLAVHK